MCTIPCTVCTLRYATMHGYSAVRLKMPMHKTKFDMVAELALETIDEIAERENDEKLSRQEREQGER
eukprot:584425-Amphidinium_carterae.1